MPETIACPACGRPLLVPFGADASTMQCPECRHTFTARLPERAAPGDDFYAPERFRRPLTPSRGATILTLGIVSLFLMPCSGLLGLLAWIMGTNDLAQIRAGRMEPGGARMAQAGRVLGIISMILAFIVCLGACFLSIRN